MSDIIKKNKIPLDVNWLNKLFNDGTNSSEYIIWPEMLEKMKNNIVLIEIENKWHHVKFQGDGHDLKILII